MSFGTKLRYLRKSSNLTQKEIAAKLYVEQATISAYEKEKILPTSDTIVRTALLFNVSSDYLLDISISEQNEILNYIKKLINENPSITEDLYTLLKILSKYK